MGERRFGPKTDENGQKKRDTALASFEKVAKDGRKRFSSFAPSKPGQYKVSVNQYVNAVLSVLNLAGEHRENLRGRGLTDENISRLGYKSVPVGSGIDIADRLLGRGAQLAGVPGFFRTKSGQWAFVHQRPGILIPVKDIYGQVQGLQVRLDDTAKRKFRWVSSGTFSCGYKAEGWTHLAGEPKETILLTEGPMKADIIHALTGLTVLDVPGVNALTKLEKALSELRQAGLWEIKTAFDMDYCTNWYVQKGYDELLHLLGHMGFRYGTYVWDPRYKGLDDFIWAKLQK